MNNWTDPHLDTIPEYGGLGQCAGVSALLSALIMSLALYGITRRRDPRLLTVQLLLSFVMLAAACVPLIDYFYPAWRSTNDRETLDALGRAVSGRSIFLYIACASSLGLLGYLALSKRCSMQRAFLWLSLPALVGLAFAVFGLPAQHQPAQHPHVPRIVNLSP